MGPALVAVACGDAATRELLLRVVERAGFAPTPVEVTTSDISGLTGPVDAGATLAVLDLDAAAPAVIDAIRAHPASAVSGLRVVVLADGAAVGRRAWAAGADGFLDRPFHHDRLVATLRDVRDRPEAAREPVRRAAATEYLGRQGEG